MLAPGRRRSWKTSSQHRKPNANVGLNDLAATQYSRQLNPYKGSAKTSLRGSNGSKDNSVTRRPSASDDDLGIANGELDLGESDDDLGLDDILSSITGLKDGKDEDAKTPSYKPASKKSEVNTNGDSAKSNDTTQPPSSSGGTEAASSIGESAIFEEKKDLLKEILDANPLDRPQISEVDFGKDFRAHRRLTPPVNNTSSADEISLVSDGEDTLDNTLWTDGDATRQHKLMLKEDDQAPAFSSGFEDNNARLESMPLTGPSLPTGTKGGSGGNSLVDSLLEDVATINGDNSETESKKPPPQASNTLKTPLRGGRFSSARYQRTKLHDGPQSSRSPASDENGSEKPLVIQKKEDDTTLSTVTDPSESPFIYTYKKDDDSVSQITSSVATSLGSSLQNIPSNFGSNRRKGTGLSWTSTSPGMGGFGSGGRMTQRKMVIPGPYGRDRNRRSAKKASGRGSRSGSGSGSGSGSQGGSVGSSSYDRGGNLDDEFSYSLNADSRPRRVSRRSPRTNSREALGMMGDDLSTVQSSTYQQPSHQMSHGSSVDLKSNVSRLGMGGVSCGASDASVTSDTSTSTMGLIQSVSFFAWKAKHYAGRFFLPTSPVVERRKKYDRADSMSDIEEMLAEEGANTLPHRKRKGSRHDDDDDEEVDYFGRAMSASGLRSPKKGKPRKKYFWQGKTGRIVGSCLLLAVAITIWRMSSKEGEKAPTLVRPDNGEFRAGKQRQYEGGEQEDSPEAQQHFVQLPSNFDSLANVEDPFQRGDDVPFYWHVPRSGGGTMNDALGSCLHLTLAADAGGSEGHGQEESLKVLHFSRQVSYVNVDTSTHQGIARAKNLNLASSGLADVVISPLLYDASTLFSPTQKGRMFTILRHPVERAASLFYFVQETQWKKPGSRNDQFADISIEDFYQKGFAENNWMVRFLTNELSGELSEDNLTVAKEVLRQKCLVGLLEEKGESFERMLNYFGWQPKNDDELECLEKKLEYAWSMKHKHPKVESGTRALIEEANQLDLRLYEYAKDLFTQQAELFPR